MQRCFDLEELFGGFLPRRETRRQDVQNGNRIDDPSADSRCVGEIVLHQTRILHLLLITVFLIIIRRQEIKQKLFTLQVLDGRIRRRRPGAQHRRIHALMKSVSLIIRSQQNMHSLGEILPRHDHPRTMRVYRPPFIEQLPRVSAIREKDERLSPELGAHDGPVLLGPLVEDTPRKLLRCLVEVADEGEARWAWGEVSVSFVFVDETEEDDGDDGEDDGGHLSFFSAEG